MEKQAKGAILGLKYDVQSWEQNVLGRTVNLTEYTVLPQSEPDVQPYIVGKIQMLAFCRILRFVIWTCVERVVAILVQTVRAECVPRVLQNIPFEINLESSWERYLDLSNAILHQSCALARTDQTGGRGSSTSAAHDDPFILLLGGGHGQSSLLRTEAVPSGEVVIRAVYTWLSKRRGHAL
ncbi:unnamed protein product [Prunus armeniaca]